MKLELRIGKVTKEFVKGDRREVSTVEDINVTVEVAADELVETVKAIKEAIDSECKNSAVVESKKDNDSVMEIQLGGSRLSTGRYEIDVYVDGCEYILFTAHKDVIENAIEGRLTKEGIKRVLSDAGLYKMTVESSEAISGVVEITNFLDMISSYKGKKVVVR